jgi:RNA polymerase sigma-70 factor (ECF subfamily)
MRDPAPPPCPAEPSPGGSGRAPERRELDRPTLARAQRGDEAACRTLVACYHRAVFALLWRMLGPGGRGDVVEDLAQETFLRAFRALAGFDAAGPARLSTWLLTIATRLALDELRRHAPVLAPLEAASHHAAEERTDAGVLRRSLALAITRAVEGLSPEYRAAFVLREFHDLACEEIASALKIEPDTVRSRLSRARAALRTALAETQGD